MRSVSTDETPSKRSLDFSLCINDVVFDVVFDVVVFDVVVVDVVVDVCNGIEWNEWGFLLRIPVPKYLTGEEEDRVDNEDDDGIDDADGIDDVDDDGIDDDKGVNEELTVAKRFFLLLGAKLALIADDDDDDDDDGNEESSSLMVFPPFLFNMPFYLFVTTVYELVR